MSVIDRVRALEPFLRERTPAIEQARTLTPDVVDALYDAGVFTALTPQSLGGHEMHPIDWLDMTEELSRINGSCGWLAMTNGGVNWATLNHDVAARLLADKPRAIAAGNQTPGGTAQRTAEGFLINGRWKFTSGCMHADYISCMTIDHDAKPGMVAMLQRDEVTIEDTFESMGLCATGSHDVVVDNVEVPAERMAGRRFSSPSHEGPLYRFQFILMAHGSHALGVARAAVDAAIAVENAGYGPLQAMIGRDSAKIAIGEAEAIVRAARAYLWAAVQRAHDEVTSGDGGPVDATEDGTVNAQLAMLHAVNQSARAVQMVFDLASSRSVLNKNRLGECFRDIHAAKQHVITARPNYRVLGEYLLTKDNPEGATIGPGVYLHR